MWETSGTVTAPIAAAGPGGARGRRGGAPMAPRYRVVGASLLVAAVSRKEPVDGRLTYGPGIRPASRSVGSAMGPAAGGPVSADPVSTGPVSADASVPQPRVAGLDVSDSALLATLLREAPIGFAFFGTDLRFRRINRSLAPSRRPNRAPPPRLAPTPGGAGSPPPRAK